MQLIFHIGLAKTGTSALQKSFSRDRGMLRRFGILFPKNPEFIRHEAHILFQLQILKPSKVYSNVKQLLDQNAHLGWDGLHRANMDYLRQQIQEANPDCVLLSSEYMGNEIETPETFEENLSSVFSDLKFVVYLRRPSSLFVSKLHQYFKGDYRPIQLPEISFAPIVDSYTNLFGEKAVEKRIYHRSVLYNGDIVSDFYNAYIDNKCAPPTDQPIEKNNVSLSSEALSIVSKFREQFFFGRSQQDKHVSQKLVKQLRIIDQKLASPRARLKDGLADLIDGNSDAILMREKYGICFPNFDYDFHRNSQHRNISNDLHHLEDLLIIDQKLRKNILLHLSETNWARKNPEWKNWNSSLLSNKS